jgi:superfamily II DNA or RNA helicase
MESQHAPAETWREIAVALDVPYRIGLSATPYIDEAKSETIRDMTLTGLTGDSIIDVPDAIVIDLNRMATPIVHMVPAGGKWLGDERDWHVIRRTAISGNQSRNDMIKDMAFELLKAGKKVIILATEIAHGKALAAGVSSRLGEVGREQGVYMFQGGSKFTEFRYGVAKLSEHIPIYDVAEKLELIDDGYVLVGSPAVDEDADFPDADVLIYCSAGKSVKQVVQRVGRVLRAKPAPNIAHIIDFDDRNSFVLKTQSRKRRLTYISRYGDAKRFRVYDHQYPASVTNTILNVDWINNFPKRPGEEVGGGGEFGRKAISVRGGVSG